MPLGTLKGDWAQYGGVPGPFSASAGAAAASASNGADRGQEGHDQRGQPDAGPAAAARRLAAGDEWTSRACLSLVGVKRPPSGKGGDGRRRAMAAAGWLPRGERCGPSSALMSG